MPNSNRLRCPSGCLVDLLRGLERLFLECDLKHDLFLCQLAKRFMKAQSDFVLKEMETN